MNLILNMNYDLLYGHIQRAESLLSSHTLDEKVVFDMIGEAPRDFVGRLVSIVLAKGLEKKNDSIKDWKMRVLVQTNYYPVSLEFNEGLSIRKGSIMDPTLEVKFDMDTLVELVTGVKSPLKCVLSGDIKMKGFFRHPIAGFRFYNLMVASIGG